MARLEAQGIATRQGTHAPVAPRLLRDASTACARGLPQRLLADRLTCAAALSADDGRRERAPSCDALRTAPPWSADRCMCGIAGIVDAGRRRRSPSAMLRADDRRDRAPRPGRRGLLRRRPGRPRHRRLAIIDLSAAGHQPMANEDRRPSSSSYNGEIYNFQRAARASSRARGHRFRSHDRHRSRSCTPTRSGATACVERFNGMFAFAVWRPPRPARPPLPRPRPLRHQAALLRAATGDTLAVRLRDQGAAAASRGLGARVSPAALLEYFTFQNIFTDLTLFEGVRLLPPGCTLIRDARRRGRVDARRATGTSSSTDRRPRAVAGRDRGGAVPALRARGRPAARLRRAGRARI